MAQPLCTTTEATDNIAHTDQTTAETQSAFCGVTNISVTWPTNTPVSLQGIFLYLKSMLVSSDKNDSDTVTVVVKKCVQTFSIHFTIIK
jgi:hypothetical protein